MLAHSEKKQVGQFVRRVATPSFVGLPCEEDIGVGLTDGASRTIERDVAPDDPENGCSCHDARNKNLQFLFHQRACRGWLLA